MKKFIFSIFLILTCNSLYSADLLDQLYQSSERELINSEIRQKEERILSEERSKAFIEKCKNNLTLSASVKESLASILKVDPRTIDLARHQATRNGCDVTIYHPEGICKASVTSFYKNTYIIKSITNCSSFNF